MDASPTTQHGFRTFLAVLANTAIASITTSFVWFAMTFWIYAETRNVIVTGVIGGTFMLLIAIFSMFFGTLVDRFRKKDIMVWATIASLVLISLATTYFIWMGEAALTDLSRPFFWFFAVLLLAGCVIEQLRTIALSTTVTLLVPAERRANANGLVGTTQGIAFIITSALSGLAVGFLGMGTTLLITVGALVLVLGHLLPIRIPEPVIVHEEEAPPSWIDFKGGWRAVLAVPGLLALVLFSTLNNLYGGVAMTVIDPYGIELFGVKGWGVWLAVGSTGMIVGGLIVSARGLGANPVRTLLLVAMAIGAVGILATIREAGWLFILGVWLFMLLMPAAEAAEQTIIQRVVPLPIQGRVFGFAQTFEAAAAPLVAFVIAPLAELWVIPYMDTERGKAQWDWLVGQGDSRGIALLFVLSGFAAIALAVIALASPHYRLLSDSYRRSVSEDASSERDLHV